MAVSAGFLTSFSIEGSIVMESLTLSTNNPW